MLIMKYVSLHNHTSYSFLDSTCKIPDMVARAKELGYTALAMTDHGNIFGAIEFYQECQEQGIKPVLGIEAYIVERMVDKERSGNHIILLAMNNKGWENIVKLVSWSNIPINDGGGFYYKPRIDLEQLFKHNEGIIVLTACVSGLIPKLMVNDPLHAEQLVKKFKEIFGDRFYLEVQNVNRPHELYIPEQLTILKESRRLGKKYDIPVVATNDCLTPGTTISTVDGCKNIEHICAGDYVYTHDGTPKRVEFTNSREVDEEIIHIKPTLGSAEIKCTKNHPILIRKRKHKGRGWKSSNPTWIKASEVQDSDILCIPKYKLKLAQRESFVSIHNIWQNIKKRRGYRNENGYIKSSRHLHINIPNELLLDRHFFQVLGLYLAEGSVDKNKITFTFHKNERVLADIVCSYFEKFNLHPKITERKECAITVCLSSFVFSYIFKMFIGCGAKNKYIQFLNNLTENEIDTILRYYFIGDGHLGKNAFMIGSVSRNLIYQISQYLNYKGILSIPTHTDGVKCAKRHPNAKSDWNDLYILNFSGQNLILLDGIYNVVFASQYNIINRVNNNQKFFQDDQYFYTSIRAISTQQYCGNVYNIQVAENETYVANAYIMHNCHYINKDDNITHEIWKAIGSKQTLATPPASANNPRGRIVFNGYDYYLQSTEEMLGRFTEEEVFITETIANRCNVEIELKPGSYMPKYNKGLSDEDTHKLLIDTCRQYVMQHKLFTKRDTKYVERIKKEFADIKDANLAHYFLIVHEIAKYADDNGIPRGPGRGSAAGSLVSYCLGITKLDPIKYGLIWERFYNKGRKGSMPDIDLDFCIERRDEIISYLRTKFGNDRIYPMATISTLAGKVALKDVGRTIGLDFDYLNKITRQFPHKCGSITDAIEQSEVIKKLSQGVDKDINNWTKCLEGETNKLVRQGLKQQISKRKSQLKMLFQHALKLEDCKRQRSSHACAILMSDKSIDGSVPLSYDTRNKRTLTGWDMYTLEKLGYLKLDVLGIKSITVIDKVRKLISKFKKPHYAEEAETFDDSVVFRAVARGDTIGIFQLESYLGQTWCRKVKPHNIDAWSDVISLIRPAILETGAAEQYVKAKKSGDIEYIHPNLQSVLKPTNGIMLYQEEMIEMVQIVAGFSLEQADVLRAAIGKKKIDKMQSLKKDFVIGCSKNGYDQELSEQLWELIEAGASYSFNKSHSMAYAIIGYIMAYYKCYFPIEFYTVMLNMASNEQKPHEEIAKLYYDALAHGIQIKHPNIKYGNSDFIVNDNIIYYGLKHIKSIGKLAIGKMKKLKGVTSEQELRNIITQHNVTRGVVLPLLYTGAFDDIIDPTFNNRLTFMHELEILYALTNKRRDVIFELEQTKEVQTIVQSGHSNSFRAATIKWYELNKHKIRNSALSNLIEGLYKLQPCNEHITTMAQLEEQYLGVYMHYCEADLYTNDFDNIHKLNSIIRTPQRNIILDAIVCIKNVREVTSKKNSKLILAEIVDTTGKVTAMLIGDAYNEYKHLMDRSVLLLSGKMSGNNFIIHRCCVPK